MNRIKLISLAFAVVLINACSSAPIKKPELASAEIAVYYAADFEAVMNSDIAWMNGAKGIEPLLNSFAEQLLHRLESEVASGKRDFVLSCGKRYLSDPQRYVVAHVLLTYLSGREYQNSRDSWNGLRFENGSPERSSRELVRTLETSWSTVK